MKVLAPIDTSAWKAKDIGRHADAVRQRFADALADW